MTTQRGGRTPSWRNQVKSWLGTVAEQQRQFPWLDLRSTALRVPFPRSEAIKVLQPVLGPLAAWLMRRLLRAVAAELGVQLTDLELDVLTQVALTLAQAAL